ncbi:MAG: glycosyltransferase family 39 protein [Candidatus Omnitrophica bacterium]|nr:glycosyltransferase family 39 protein [Candidatus Omnitrophota bacterium]
MILFAVLPLTFAGVLWRWLTRCGFDAREALLAAGIIVGVLVVAATEAFTLVHQLNFIALLFFWSLLTAGIAMMLWRLPAALIQASPQDSLTTTEKIMLGLAAFIVAAVGVIALIAPPNTSDSLIYHMARVAHWQQNNGVMNYPTNNVRQLVYWPFAEYLILQFQILTAGDRLVNMVQWAMMVMSAVAASLIGRALGVARRGQMAIVLLTLTLPMGIVQGSSTQNDYVVTALLAGAVYFVLKAAQAAQRRWIMLAAAGLGLAVFTKGTGLVMGGALLLMSFFLAGLDGRRKILLLISTLLAVAVLTGPFWVRLTAIDRNPFAAMEKSVRVSMERFGPKETASNALRNLSTQLALPWNAWNRAIEAGVKNGHQALGIDVVDPATTFASPFTLVYEADEDVVNNPFHMLLILIAGIYFWFYGVRIPLWRWYALMLGFGALLFCLTVKWQPWISRFHLPFFVLAMPLTVAILDKRVPRPVLTMVLVAAFLAALYPMAWNNTRRLVSEKNIFTSSREQQYFARDRGWYMTVARVVGALKTAGCRDVGLKFGSNEWEYPWQVMLGSQTRVEQVGVVAVPAEISYPDGPFAPCAVIDMVSPEKPRAAVFNGQPFVKAGEGREFALYVSLDLARKMSGQQ